MTVVIVVYADYIRELINPLTLSAKIIIKSMCMLIVTALVT